ncbi:MAG: AraC family transcriptional regulator [Lachnospiraceae bacterium]|nr:AraC family transcriptional regulator [Lachnospiraceae bacterium]
MILVDLENVKETYPLHWHDAAEFILIIKDGCKHRISGTLYEANAGDILLIWPHQLHETIKFPHGGAIIVHFPVSIIGSSLDLVSISRFLYACHCIKSETNKALANFIENKIGEIKKIHSSTDFLSETRCRLCIYDILLKVGEYVLSENERNADSNVNYDAGWKYINDACKYIVENSSSNLTQATVADHTGLSTFYFSKLFKQYIHMSFPTYLANVRVRNAASFLLDDSLTINECAYKAGFQSISSFNKAFHDIIGHSPREFRKMHI